MFARLVLPSIVLSVCTDACSPARARTVTQSIPVKAIVNSSCRIGSDAHDHASQGTLDFGYSQDITTAADIEIVCNSVNGTPIVTLNAGENAIGAQRNLKGPRGALITYELLQGPGAGAPPWNGSGRPVSISGTMPQPIPIWGRITGIPSDAPDGSYTDTVEIELEY